MKTIIAVIAVAAVSGCGVVDYRHAELCEGARNTFIGIPYSYTESCVTVSESGSSGDTTSPEVPTPLEEQ